MDRAVSGARCAACDARFYPAPRRCPVCLGDRLEAVALAAAGTIRTTATVELAMPGVAVPYAVAWVDLDDGVRLFGRLSGEPEPGRRVRVTADELGLPRFEVTR